MKTTFALSALTVAIFSSLSVSALAEVQPSHPKMFGKDAPFQIIDLPSQSRLRKSLEALSPAVQQLAMKHLHEFSFPEHDVNDIQADVGGGIFYIDATLPQPITATGTTTTATVLPTVDVFKLHSKPSSTNKVFLDFDGHVITGTAWNTGTGSLATYNAAPFDTDGFPGSFSTDERAAIHEIWHRIAEDYAPFDIDVTTEQPASFGPTTGRILFSARPKSLFSKKCPPIF